MGRTLYLECTSGISGDMTVAALLDLGASQERLEEVLAGMPLHGFSTRVSRVTKSGVDACDFDVILDEPYENHDHDMAWLFGHEDAEAPGGKKKRGKKAKKRDRTPLHEILEQPVPAVMTAPGERLRADESASIPAPCACGDAGGLAAEDEAHAHEHAVADEAQAQAAAAPADIAAAPLPQGAEGAGAPQATDHAHEHHHEHRTLADVTAVLDATPMSGRARDIAGRIFAQLAAAEAKAHGTTPDQVRFHEVGAVDSIVDVVAAAVCLDSLDVTDVIVPELTEGRGTIRCAHGILPIPVPAVCAITSEAKIPVRISHVRGELVTPTGAAVVAAVRTSGTLPERFVIQGVGLGAGKRAYEGCSGILRAMLVEPVETPASEAEPQEKASRVPRAGQHVICKLECDMDDCTGEALGHAIRQLMQAGARDAHAVPIVMKKGRPGYQLQVLCDPDDAPRLEGVIFDSTTTIGVRSTLMTRTCLPRAEVCLRTPFGDAQAKQVVLPDGSVRTYPEYESVAALARRCGVAFQDVYRAVAGAGAAQSMYVNAAGGEAAHLALVDDEEGVPPLRLVPTEDQPAPEGPNSPDDGWHQP